MRLVLRMFGRFFWLISGIVIGVVIWRKLTKVAHSYTPAGLTERAQTNAQRAELQWRSFVGDVRSLTAAREHELRVALETDRPQRDRGQRGRRRGDGRELRARHTTRAADERPSDRHGD